MGAQSSSTAGPRASLSCGCGHSILRRRARCPAANTASSPFWSPDNRSIAFFADAKLKRMEIGDGSMRTLVGRAPAPLGGTWNRDGTILFSASPGQPILRVSAEMAVRPRRRPDSSRRTIESTVTRYSCRTAGTSSFLSAEALRPVASTSGNSTAWTASAWSPQMLQPRIARPDTWSSCEGNSSLRSHWISIASS